MHFICFLEGGSFTIASFTNYIHRSPQLSAVNFCYVLKVLCPTMMTMINDAYRCCRWTKCTDAPCGVLSRWFSCHVRTVPPITQLQVVIAFYSTRLSLSIRWHNKARFLGSAEQGIRRYNECSVNALRQLISVGLQQTKKQTCRCKLPRQVPWS